ncbi:uncharacterized protein LOC142326790 isoform X2 [Lycorma delicatula]|uniref:uncharacterized protein LOC142326790 isoform X2 n=1 Tax=Lycorma delicatula TaxID=130591 RepID=UPI003F5130C5
MLFKNQVFCIIILHLSIIIVISASNSKILNAPSSGKLNPVHRSFDERKISKRHNEPDFQTCLDNFEIYQDKIIRTQDSRAMGARYINERDVASREDCLRLCCETPDCDVFVFEERSPGSCYLFQCGTPEEFKCKFTKHKNYTSAVLAINRHMTELESQIKLTKHEHELSNLRQSDSSPTAIIPVSITESTLLPENKETEQLIPSSPNNNSVNNNRHCSRYQFECRSSEECIAIYNACDGIPQCSDGSDEAPELGCPALLTTIIPAERINQEIPENMMPSKINADSSLHVFTSPAKHQHIHQSVPSSIEQQIHHTSKEYNSDSWIQQSPSYRSEEQPHSQQHHRHQELQLEEQQKHNQLLHQQQLQEHEQQHQKQQQIQRQQELQHQQLLLQETQQQKLQQQDQRQQLEQTALQPHVSTGGNYVPTNGGIQQSPQILTMSSQIPQQHQQLQQTQQLQPSQIESIQPPQQLINQAKLYGREGEGLIYHSPSAADTLRWPSNSYQQEQTQENLPYHVSNPGMSQIFNHKGNSLVSQSERVGNQYGDTIPNEYSRYNNYFDNSQYRMLPHTQQTAWQNAHKQIHDMTPIDDAVNGPHEGESAVQPGLSVLAPDYYYEENMRNKLQQQLLAQQRLVPQNNMPIASGDQLIQVANVEMKNPVHEEITLDHVNHELQSTGEGTSVKKASAHHPSLNIITTEKPKEEKVHHYGHNSHRKMEQLTAEVTLRETSFDGVAIQDGGSPSGAILSLTLGMCVTSVMIVLVGCRMRTVRRRMRRGGKSAYAHDADFLVNGMYL